MRLSIHVRRPGMVLLVVLGLVSLQSLAAPPLLPALNIDIEETSFSGISSGGFMSVQFQVAHSSLVKGVGIVAGGPYYCSQNSVGTAVSKCSCTGEPTVACAVTDTSADVPSLVAATSSMYQRGLIDAPTNIAKQKVMTLSGEKDTLVPPAIADQLSLYYGKLGLPTANFSAVKLENAAHTMPTLNYGAACEKQAEPYIGKCAFDSVKAILGWIYGPLQAPSGKRKGRFIQFDQAAYIPKDWQGGHSWISGLDRTGWLYVPASCSNGAQCRLHVAMHGCKQGQSYLPLTPPAGGGLYYGTTFVKNTGYDRWADNNRVVVLFPQAVSIPLLNPNGCWDWWGYTGENYANQKGVQIRTLRAMIAQLASGATPR